MEYTILILLLPFVSFLVLGLAGMKMRPVAAGLVGTAVLAAVALVFALNVTAMADAPFEAVQDNPVGAKRTVEQVEANYAYGPVTLLHQDAAAD